MMRQMKSGCMALCLLALGSGIAGTPARAQAPLEVKPDGQVQTSGMAALGLSSRGGQKLGQVGQWQALELDHTITALLAEKNILFSISPRRGGDVFLMLVLKGQEVRDPALSVRFSSGQEVRSFHYTGIINRGTQWGCYVSEAEGRALFEALASSTSVTVSWKGGERVLPFDQGAVFVRTLRETARQKVMPFPR